MADLLFTGLDSAAWFKLNNKQYLIMLNEQQIYLFGRIQIVQTGVYSDISPAVQISLPS